MSSQAPPAHSQHLFQYLFQHASLGIAVEDLDGKILLANPALCSMLGYTEKELCSMSCAQFANSEDSKDDWALFQKLRAGVIDSYSLEKRYLRKDGAKLWGRLNVSLLKEGDRGSPMVFAFVENITDRKRAEEAQRQSELELQEAQRLAKIGNWRWDTRQDSVTWSKELSRLLGHNPNLPAPSFKEHPGLYTAESWDRLQRAVQDALQTGASYELDLQLLDPASITKWVIGRGEPLRSPDGQIVGLRGTVQDVTESKWAEQALQQSEDKFSKAFRESPVSLTLTSAIDHRYIDVNETFEQMSGWRRDEVIGRSPFDIGIWADPTQRLEFVKRVLAEGAVRGSEIQYLSKDGTQRVGLGAGELIQIGNEPCILSAIADITERKRAEEALRESEDKLRLLLDSTAEAIYGVDAEHRCTFCNTACLRILGYERVADVVGRNIHNLMHHTRADGTLFPLEECRVHGVFRTGEGVHVEDELFWRANGTCFPAEYWSYPQRKGQEVIGTVVTFIDITERKRAEAALANVSRKLIEAQEQERSRIGRELHDDIGQRLALLAVELQQLQEDYVILPEARSRVGELQKQTSEIAADIQSLSHELHSAKLQYLGIVSAVRGFCREFSEQQKVEVDFESHDFTGKLSADISLCLFRVLQEALHNSAKHSGVRRFEVRLWGTPDAIHLTVRDSGVGFDRDAAKMSPGLGLISMEERLKLVLGTLSIESHPKGGTSVHARVPLNSEIIPLRAAG